MKPTKKACLGFQVDVLGGSFKTLGEEGGAKVAALLILTSVASRLGYRDDTPNIASSNS